MVGRLLARFGLNTLPTMTLNFPPPQQTATSSTYSTSIDKRGLQPQRRIYPAVPPHLFDTMLHTILQFAVLLVTLTRRPSAAAELEISPPCCVCSDNCQSTITIPDAVVPHPEGVGADQATCAQILDVAEVQRLIPASFCKFLDREDFRCVVLCLLTVVQEALCVSILTQICFFLICSLVCGCENRLVTEAPVPSPVFASSPVKLVTSPGPSVGPTVVNAPLAAPTVENPPIFLPVSAPSPEPTGSPMVTAPVVAPQDKDTTRTHTGAPTAEGDTNTPVPTSSTCLPLCCISPALWRCFCSPLRRC